MTIAGAISESGSSCSLTLSGNGTLILNGSNNYSGGTTVSGGVLEFTNTNSMPAVGTVTIASGATLAVSVGGAGGFTTVTTGTGSIGALISGNGGQASR